MKTYFFHLKDGPDVLVDPEGRQLPDLDAAVAIALFEARTVMAADVLTGVLRLSQCIAVEDEIGAIVHDLKFTDAVIIEMPQR